MISFRDELQRLKYELNVGRMKGHVDFTGMVESYKSEQDEVIVQIECTNKNKAENAREFIKNIDNLSFIQLEIKNDSNYYKPTITYDNSVDLTLFSSDSDK